MFKFSTSVCIDGEKIEDISIETKGGVLPRMAIRLESRSHVYLYATEKQFQQIAQAIDDWRDSDAAGSPDERAS